MRKTSGSKSCLTNRLEVHRTNGLSAPVANGDEPRELRQRLMELTNALENAERKLAEATERHQAAEELRRHEFRAERERIRTVLHDGVGQFLTSLSFIAASLRQKLAERNLPGTAEAQEIVELANKAVAESRGLFPPGSAKGPPVAS